MSTPLAPDAVGTIDDLHQGRPHVISSFVLLGAEPALVDPGPASCLPALEAGLAGYGLALQEIRTILLTHIHLDHAGATGVIVARDPTLHVYVHERGVAHLVDPSRLINSATQLYGDKMQLLWGEIRPVPQELITPLRGGEALQVAGRTVRAFDAPGHARHHLVYLDELSGTAFIGDNGGVRLPGLSFARPATPPPEVDIEHWLQTLDLIAGLHPRWLALTHFGAYNDVESHLRDYRARLLRWAEYVRRGLESGASEQEQLAGLEQLALDEVADRTPEEREALTEQSGAIAASWRGLARYWRKMWEAAG